MSEREKLKKLAEEATGGEWSARGLSDHVRIERKNEVGTLNIAKCGSSKVTPRETNIQDTWANAKFIAAANPSTILALLSELEQAEAKLEHVVPFEEYDKAMIRADDLQKFKKYVHDRLDAAGIDKHEEQNALNGCRIGSRLDDVLKAAAQLEQAERERELTRVELKQSCEERERLLAAERTKLQASEAALRTLRQASACSVTQPKVAMAGRNFAVVKMTFPTQKQAQTFKDELTKAIG